MKTLFVSLFLLAVSYSQTLKVPTRVIPDKVNIQLCRTIFDTIRIPVINLYLQTPQYNSIWASENLFVDVYFRNKELVLHIRGYDQVDNTEYSSKSDRIIAGDYQFTYRNIMILPSYFSNDSLKITIKLNGIENRVLLVKSNLECRLSPISVSNINLDPKWMSTILYPLDVYNLYLSGHINSNYNYFDDLLEFAKSRRIELANSKYGQVEIGNRLGLLIVLNELEFNKLAFKKVGNLPGHDDVQVNVKRILDFCCR